MRIFRNWLGRHRNRSYCEERTETMNRVLYLSRCSQLKDVSALSTQSLMSSHVQQTSQQNKSTTGESSMGWGNTWKCLLGRRWINTVSQGRPRDQGRQAARGEEKQILQQDLTMQEPVEVHRRWYVARTEFRNYCSSSRAFPKWTQLQESRQEVMEAEWWIQPWNLKVKPGVCRCSLCGIRQI